MISSVGTLVGAQTEPGTVALFFFGEKRVDLKLCLKKF